jgi:hypothetical protein
MNKIKQDAWYRWFHERHRAMRYSLPFGIAMIFFVTWYFLVLRPVQNAVVWYQKNMNIEHKKYLSLVKLQEQVERLELDVIQQKEEKNSNFSSGSKNFTEDALLENAHKNQLQIVEYIRGKKITKKWFSKTALTLVTTGSKESIVAFLRDLKKDQRMIEIPEVSYQFADAKNSRVVLHCFLINTL